MYVCVLFVVLGAVRSSPGFLYVDFSLVEQVADQEVGEIDINISSHENRKVLSHENQKSRRFQNSHT